MIIDGIKYKAVDAYNDVLSIADSWVVASNKVGKGHGEAKLYYGPKNSLLEIFTPQTTIRCFVLKSDLLKFMEAQKPEYFSPKEEYKERKRFKKLYQERLGLIQALPNEINEFELHFQQHLQGGRGYVNTKDGIYKLLRTISIPVISFLSVMKFENEANEADIRYYWRLSVDIRILFAKNRAEAFVHRYGIAQMATTPKERKGQSSYRKKLLEEFNYHCAVTDIDNTELLIASHIKPWCVSKREEKTDVNNGLLLSPLYDRLFDKGFITFDPERRMVISTWLSLDNRAKLYIPEELIANYPVSKEREEYMDYHRNKIFRGKIE